MQAGQKSKYLDRSNILERESGYQAWGCKASRLVYNDLQ